MRADHVVAGDGAGARKHAVPEPPARRDPAVDGGAVAAGVGGGHGHGQGRRRGHPAAGEEEDVRLLAGHGGRRRVGDVLVIEAPPPALGRLLAVRDVVSARHGSHVLHEGDEVVLEGALRGGSPPCKQLPGCAVALQVLRAVVLRDDAGGELVAEGRVRENRRGGGRGGGSGGGRGWRRRRRRRRWRPHPLARRRCSCAALSLRPGACGGPGGAHRVGPDKRRHV
mmetsp:Transcript_208/g.612  ORF Transcript_208/g.612 Transcript_208/m.612 type:complete len:225 (+) Transcript_208:955-1629(+)